jgi:serine/threonine-protein kinase HipA
VSVLDVLLHGKAIGTLTSVPGDRTLFAFNDAYIADRRRPTLSLAFKDTLGELIVDFRPTQTRLLPYFSNLLPEGRMRSYLAERAGVSPMREFFLLCALGIDLPGAITVRRAGGERWPSTADAEAGTLLPEDERGNAMRFSLAGLQLKFSAIAEARGGLTIPVDGAGGSWIVKLPSREFQGVAENEFSMLTLAARLGMDVPRIRLVEPASIGNLPERLGGLHGQALATERYDRLPGGERVHIEDFAQVFGVYPDDKYGRGSLRSIARVLAAESATTDIVEFIRRLVFNALIGNADMHLKNWSLIYRDRRTPALAPAYDFVSTIVYVPEPRAALNFSRTKRFDGLTRDELQHFSAKALLAEKLVLDTARETVALFHQHWSAEKTNLPLSSAVVRAIEDHVRTIPIAGASAL